MAARDEMSVIKSPSKEQPSRAAAIMSRLAPKPASTNLRSVDDDRLGDVDIHILPPEKPRRKSRTGIWSFLLVVVLPVIAGIVYYGFMATDQFVSEARFAVRSLATTKTESSTSGQGMTASTGVLNQDAYVVSSFIHSSEILRRINAKVDLRSFFNTQSIDSLSRLPSDATSEDMLKYWSKQVTTYIDGPSGIITLYVRAFSPEAAQRLADMVTQESEQLVNEMSERSRQDIVARAQSEVEKTEGNYRRVLGDLNAYQNASGFLDPAVQAGETGKLLLNLMAQKLEIDSRLIVVASSVSDNAPSVQQLKRQQRSLQDQIEKLRSDLANDRTADDNLSKALKRFAELETDRMVAEGLYEAARRNLASAQAEAIGKSVYVTVFVPPALPEDSIYPARFFSPMMLFFGLAIAWSIGALGWAAVEDHRL